MTLIPGHTLRHPTPDDADAVLAVIVARDVADLGRPDYTLEDLHADWTMPGVDPATDAWVVQEGTRLVGYAFLDDRGAALVSVAPDAEGQGIGTALREAAEARAVERGEALVRQYVPVANETARALLLEAGYWPVHHYFRMRIGLAAAPPPPRGTKSAASTPSATPRPSTRSSRTRSRQIEGNVPQTLDAWRAAKIEKRGWDPALWLLAEDAEGLVAAALCERWEAASATSTRSPSPSAPAAAASAARCCGTRSRRCATPASRSPSCRCRARTPAPRGSTRRPACARCGRRSAGRRRSATAPPSDPPQDPAAARVPAGMPR